VSADIVLANGTSVGFLEADRVRTAFPLNYLEKFFPQNKTDENLI
jgi:hypothetical protein